MNETDGNVEVCVVVTNPTLSEDLVFTIDLVYLTSQGTAGKFSLFHCLGTSSAKKHKYTNTSPEGAGYGGCGGMKGSGIGPINDLCTPPVWCANQISLFQFNHDSKNCAQPFLLMRVLILNNACVHFDS